MSDDDSQRTAEDVPLPGGNFRMFVTRLSFQGLLSCGVLENPVTKTKDVNLDGARMILDDLRMIRDKTAGNLDKDEHALLEKMILDLTQVYAKVSGQGGADASQAEG